MEVRKRKRSRSLTNENHIYQILLRNQPDKPIHEHRDSLFSSSSGFNNFRGFFTLALILLVLQTLRIALENIIKYGILINYSQLFWLLFEEPTSIWTILLITLLHLFILCSYLIEILLAKNRLNETNGGYLIYLNLSSVFFLPILAVLLIKIHVISSAIFCFIYAIVCLKLFSYHSVNYWCRSHQKKSHKRGNSGDYLYINNQPNGLPVTNDDSNNNDGDDKIKTMIQLNLVRYPKNLTLKDIYYFMLIPTLCYELNFPRTERIRKQFLLKRLFEVIFLTQLILALIQQWMVPTVHNSVKPLLEMDYFRMLERLLKLSIPNHVIWLIMFYTFFHSYLNLIGEVLRFADRSFYQDWWNAESISIFWKNWNQPVHRWAKRHIYVPLLKKGYSKLTATTIVFIVSGIFHEYIFSIPLKMLSYWAFLGMIVQVPFAILTSKVEGHYANIFVWFSLIIGQPLCILALFHDYYVLHYATETIGQ